MGGAATHRRRRTTFAAATFIVLGLIVAPRGGAGAAAPRAPVVPQKVWAVYIDRTVAPSVTASSLVSVRRAQINVLVVDGTGLSPAAVVRLVRIGRGARLRVLVLNRPPRRRGADEPLARCRTSPTSRIERCFAVARSVAEARRLARNRAAALVLVRVRTERALNRLRNSPGSSHIVAVLDVRVGSQFRDRSTWRRAVRTAADDRRLDIAFRPRRTGMAKLLTTYATDLSIELRSKGASGTPRDNRAPTMPAALRTTGATPTTISIAWDASRDKVGVAGYTLYRGTAMVGATQSLTYTFSGLACATSYTFGVEAYDAASNTSKRALITAATSPCPPPPPPDSQAPTWNGGMAFTGSTQTTVSLVWNAASDNVGVVGYYLYRNGVLVGSTGQLSYTFTALTCGTSYTFALEAYDAAGNRANRAEATGTKTTLACGSAPADTQAPTWNGGMAFTGSTQTTVSLVWNAASDNVGVVGYYLYRNGVLIGSTALPSYTFTGLSCGTSYTFALEAYDAAGNRANRAEATGTSSTVACDSPLPPPPPPPSPPPPADGLGHLWVHSGGGGSCTRSATPLAYDAATACPSAGAAYNAANATAEGSTILVRGGVHTTPFDISGNRTSTNRIVFDAAPGETPVFSGGWMRLGVTGVASAGPKYVTIKNLQTSEMGAGYPDPTSKFGLLVTVGSRFIRFENVSAGGFLFQGAQDIELIGGSQGPCRRVGTNGGAFGPCEINKVDHYPGSTPERILIDGVDFHDFNFGSGCSGACHWRAMYLNGVHGFTLRNSNFRNSVFEPWFTISGPDAAARGNHDILIENNHFGASTFNSSSGFGFAWCTNAQAGVVAYKNVTFRFNSFSRGMNLPTPGVLSGQAGCSVQNFNVYGNIIGGHYLGGGGPVCGIGVTWSYNVFAGSHVATCGVGDVYIGGSTMPFYRNDTTTPGPGDDDYALEGPTFAADNLVPAVLGCPVDRLGIARLLSFCDAGAHER